MPSHPVVIGRADGEIRLDDPAVSSRHAMLRPISGDWEIHDLDSTNGVFVNGQRIDRAAIVRLNDTIRLGDTIIDIVEESRRQDYEPRTEILISLSQLADGREKVIGRSDSADCQVQEAIVSRRHAVISYQKGVAKITDCESRNGTYVNGRSVTSTVLSPEDVIRIGATEFKWTEQGLSGFREKGPTRLDVHAVTHIVTAHGKPFVLLNKVDFVLKPGEFVAIVGGSGTGKTSLFRVLTGLYTPTEGKVLLNGVDYHRNPKLFAGQVGFVPQDDIVHQGLTVAKALHYTARLRLPRDTSEVECDQRAASVMGAVGLSHRANTQIRTLSGGERKRINVALELLTEPNLLYLDEPTSGLDPNREYQMMTLLRDLSRQGRTILITTHSTLNLDLCDLLIVMGPGGRIVYFGPPREATAHFGCPEYKDIFRAVGETQESSSMARKRYQSSEVCREFGGTRGLPKLQPSTSSAGKGSPALDFASWLHQFPLLAKRYVEVMISDKVNLLILLVQAPVIVIALLIMFPSNSFEGIIEANGRSPLRNATPVIFLLTIAAIWFGASNSAREIVKEFPIYVRERLAFLFPSAYFLSKFLVLAVLCLVQCAILLIGIGLGMQWFDIDGAGFMKMSAVLLLASFAGLSIGLALSSVVRSSDQAISMTPVVLLPQIVFSGLFMPEDAGKIVEVLSKLHVSYWSFGALGQILEINDKVRDLARPVMGTNKCFDGALDVKVGSLVVLLVIMVAGALFVVNRRRTR